MNRVRLTGIDTTRGIAMIIMALDHVREFFHSTAMSVSPTDLEKTTAAVFFTRWVTHLCAPAFVFLAGISARLKVNKENNPRLASLFLLKRGIWLVILEFTLVNFALWFDIRFRLLILEVIGAIGISFIILSFLVRVNSRIIGITGIIIIAAHCLVNSTSDGTGLSGILLSVFFKPGFLQAGSSFSFFTAYPVVPWLGIMMAGYGAGEFFTLAGEKRRKVLALSGIFFILAAVGLRFFNIYGDQVPWSINERPGFTIISFLNLSKYPPSLQFTLLFTGITLILLRLTDEKENRVTALLSTYGRVPLFYFVAHLFVIHLLMFIMLFFQGYGTTDFAFGLFKNGRPDAGGGVGLAGVYLAWIAVVILFYPLCKWYGKIKSETDSIILKYL